jgi:hypothetical protein
VLRSLSNGERVLTGTLILFVGTLSGLYWLRYICHAITRTTYPKDFATAVADANGLQFPESLRKLQSESWETLDSIERSLLRDYRLVCSLLEHTTAFSRQDRIFQVTLLRADYLLMRIVYRLARVTSAPLARLMLGEMAQIVRALAHSMGERTAASSRI